MAKPKKIRELIKELNPEAIFVEGFDKALYGTGKAIGGFTIAVYDADECLYILIQEHNMDELEAWEHFNNVLIQGTPNLHKPIFISDWRKAVDVDKQISEIIKEKNDTLDKVIDELQKNEDEKKKKDEEDDDEDILR